MARHVNIPIFIPHEGCKNECVFCNQRTITGTENGADRDIKKEIDEALSTIEDGAEVEIAFFGGSFTGIGIERMTRLCDIAFEYVKSGKVQSIRLSTRPDYIDDEILTILKSRGVTHIELGIQSMSDAVLSACKRGHTAEQTKIACQKILDHGFILGGQMMIGLPSSTTDDEIETAKAIVQMGAKESRIYPTVVFYDTYLCDMAKNGEYSPLSLDEAVERCIQVYKIFRESNVNVLRIGLQQSENLSSDDKVYGGANHASMGELVLGEYYYNRILERVDEIALLSCGEMTRLIIYCDEKHVSKIAGQSKKNKIRLLSSFEKYGCSDIKILGFEGLGEKIFFSSENINRNRRTKQCT